MHNRNSLKPAWLLGCAGNEGFLPTCFCRESDVMPMAEAVQTAPIHLEAQRLVVGGFLPPPFNVDAFDGRPLWSFVELSMLFDRRPDELVDLLLERGPVHLAGDRGIPSSWRALVEG
jgi:hypothetical protein